MSLLFTPLTLRSLTLTNRIIVSPMCQYSCVDGVPTDWHLVHLGSRAVGGAALVFTEAAAVSAEGRISPGDAGIWNDAQGAAWAPVTRFITAAGAVPGVQLAHAGRKASVSAPWQGSTKVDVNAGGWEPVAPSAEAFSATYWQPREMARADIDKVIDDFAAAARRALAAGFQVAEVHVAHGYLLHQFLSPLANHRQDDYGGALENRMRLPLAACQAVREVWPAEWPVFARISATDWLEGGWDLTQSLALARRMKAIGIDLIGCSSAGVALGAKIPLAPGYQTPFAEAVRRGAELPTYAVGLISEPVQAEHILATGQADAVALARALLREPYWPRRAAAALGVKRPWPDQYARCDVGPMGR